MIVYLENILVFLFIYSFDKYLLVFSIICQVRFQVLRIFLMIKAEKIAVLLKFTFLIKKSTLKNKTKQSKLSVMK